VRGLTKGGRRLGTNAPAECAKSDQRTAKHLRDSSRAHAHNGTHTVSAGLVSQLLDTVVWGLSSAPQMTGVRCIAASMNSAIDSTPHSIRRF